MNNWLKFATPPRGFLPCALCGMPKAGAGDLCPACERDLPVNRPACLRCALPVPESGPRLCGHCLQTPPPFCRAQVPFRYETPLVALITGLKFRQQLPHARLLGNLFARHREPAASLPACIVPVPLHPARLRQRGYNQALELARPVARRLGIPLRPELARRIRATVPQSDLDLAARRRNLHRAFRVAAPGADHIALFDDVMTSGQTLAALADAFLQAGARKVEVWALARAVLRHG